MKDIDKGPVLVSACLLGIKCKYNGGDNKNEKYENEVRKTIKSLFLKCGKNKDFIKVYFLKIYSFLHQSKTNSLYKVFLFYYLNGFFKFKERLVNTLEMSCCVVVKALLMCFF